MEYKMIVHLVDGTYERCKRLRVTRRCSSVIFTAQKASPLAVSAVYSDAVFYVYVLRSESDAGFYIGFSTNLRARLRQHQDGKQPPSAQIPR